MSVIDFSGSLNLFLDSLFVFINDLLNSVFLLLADVFSSVRFNLPG